MSHGIDWFRWHHGSVTDPKFQLVARKSNSSLPDVLAVWAWLLEKASSSEVRGVFGVVDAESLDCLFGFPDDEGRTGYILLEMERRGLISEGRIVAWEARQPKRERYDDSAERVRKHRSNKNHVTPCNANNNQKKPRVEESRQDKQKSNTLSGDPDVMLFVEDQNPEKQTHVTEARQLLEFLNRKTGKSFRPVEANLKPMIARLKEYSAAEVRAVIALKCEAWGRDDKMAEYLRPKTLFNATNFAQYVANCQPQERQEAA